MFFNAEKHREKLITRGKHRELYLDCNVAALCKSSKIVFVILISLVLIAAQREERRKRGLFTG